MKNLCLSDVLSKRIAFDSDNIVLCYGHSEGSSGEVYTCSHNLNVSKFDENNEISWNKDISDVASADNLPLNITFLTLTEALFVGLRNGELITLSDSGNSCDLAGVCGDGLLAVEWSPDQELLVLVTKKLDAILMSCTFDIIHEVNLLKEEFGEKQFMTVGWGKKETQFHGSEGKQAAKAKTEVVADQNINDESIKITWRGDGQLYAVGFLVDGIRRFKVFDREGQLQYTSEKQQGLEANLSWRPSGNVIATTQRLSDQYQVAFFEKNGLKHGGFPIPVNLTTKVTELIWSSDSEVLAILCVDSNGTQSILIFTTSNYQWYLKQTLLFDSRVAKVLWDNDFDVANHKRLHVFLDNGEHYSYNWAWGIDHSIGRSKDDDAVVAVIDGKRILVTGFRQTVVPPPMCAFEVELESQVNSVHFAASSSPKSNDFCVYTADCKLVFFRQTNKFPLQYEKSKTIEFEKYKFPFQCYNWFWVNDDTVVCVRVDDGVTLLEFSIEDGKPSVKAETALLSTVTKLASHPTDSSVLYLHTNDGEIIQYTCGGEITPMEFNFPASCPKFGVLSINNEVHFLGLTHKGNFYIDDSLVLNNVNSFFVHTHFLLLTTLAHVILCVELSTAGLNAIKEYRTTESAHIYKRSVERGSKLVIAVPNCTRTVLQMPRGNLEAIQPRPLSLKIIGEHLDNLKFYEAFDLMRKQRINLNLIYDHDPDKFLKHVNVFVDEIKNNTWLSLFLSDLENVDVTKTMYSSSYADRSNGVRSYDTKVGKVCDVIRDHLKQRTDSDSKVLPLLTSYVKKNTVEDLEQALDVIKKIKEEETAGAKLPVSSDEALKYLLYMVDVNTLFDVALGMYDFDLVLLVANKSQKDPKEYVAMLNEFNTMEEHFKRFSVNKHLKRFDRAVECLAKCGPEKHDELRTFVKYHSLYRKALELFSPDDEIYKQVADDYGAYLKLKKQYLEAGIIYRRAKSYEKAVECFKESMDWEMALELASSWNKEDVRTLSSELVSSLKEVKRHKEALTILEQYSDNPEEIISYAIECGHYTTALRLCSKYNRSDLRDKNLLFSLLEDYKNLSELIETNWSNFIRHRNRLQVVRENKSKQPVDVYDPSYDNRDSDLYSDAGSTVASSTSRSSSKTFRSSKNRRKHERKLASLKEGSQYEDVALIMALHSLVTSSYELRQQVKEVVLALSCFERDSEAGTLQKSLEKLLNDMKDSFKDIWNNELVLEATNAAVAALDIPEGCSALPQGISTLEPHLRIAPVIEVFNWKLEL